MQITWNVNLRTTAGLTYSKRVLTEDSSGFRCTIYISTCYTDSNKEHAVFVPHVKQRARHAVGTLQIPYDGALFCTPSSCQLVKLCQGCI